MIGFEVTLNGKPLHTTGAPGASILTAIMSFAVRQPHDGGNTDELSLELGGLTSADHLQWPVPRPLKVGDEVILRIVDTERVDPPVRKPRDDQAFVEAQERRYYERLRAKYGA